MMPVGLRSAGRSAIQPPANFAKLERPSETPSITPSANGRGAEAGQECGKDCGGGFVAPVGEKAGEADAEDAASEPAFRVGRSGMGFDHILHCVGFREGPLIGAQKLSRGGVASG